MGTAATVRLGAPAAPLNHLLVVGSSTSFGAASTGASNPKWANAWPGLLRTTLDGLYGAAGTGLVIAANDVRNNPAWDGRFTFGGTVATQPLGWFQNAVWRCTDGAANYVEMAATGSTVLIVCLAKTAGVGRVSVDGAAAKSFRVQATGGPVVDIDKLTGYHAGHVVIPVFLGGNGAHTIRVWGEGTDLDVVSFDVRTGAGQWLVSNASMNSKSMGSLINSDEAGGTYGLPTLDTAMRECPGIVAVALGSNEWTGGQTIATVQSRMTTIGNRVAAAGRPLKFFTTPQPSPSLQGGAMTYTQLCDTMAAKAAELGAGFMSLQKLWTNNQAETDEQTMYDNGNAKGYYADTIHPTDSGAATIAAALRPFLVGV